MLNPPKSSGNTVKGVLFVSLIAVLATLLAKWSVFQQFAISPLIIGIILGTLYSNLLPNKPLEIWRTGVLFSTKEILRAGIIFYGFRITLLNIGEVGMAGIVVSSSIVILTSLFGYYIGIKFLKLDRELTILITAGCSICGAAAILATEPVIKSAAHKSSIAVATVVVFGTIAMFLYPFLYQIGFLHFDGQGLGIYLGGTIHEVAHVVGAGHAINEETANTAIVVKMLRVMMLAPFLIMLSLWLKNVMSREKIVQDNVSKKARITIPWFAVGFILVVGFNSLNLLPQSWVTDINQLDTFALTIAMTALGMETRLKMFRAVGLQPFYLAGILFGWLLFAGYFITQLAVKLT